MRIYYYCLLFSYFIVIPISAIYLFKFTRNFFVSSKIRVIFHALFCMLAYSLISWGLTISCILIPDYLDFYMMRGPEIAFALFFGWLYLWFTSIPVFLIYTVLGLFEKVFCKYC